MTKNIYTMYVEGKVMIFHITKDNGKRVGIHPNTLVASAFLLNPENYPCVRRIDENPMNNRVDNLEWATLISTRGKQKPRNAMKVDQFSVDDKFIKTWNSVKEVAEQLVCARSKLYDVINGKRKTAIGFKWKYHDDDVGDEEWKLIPLPNMKFDYYVSTRGRIKRKGSKRITTGTDDRGYRATKLTRKDGTVKRSRIHQLVLLTFEGEPPTNKHNPNHKDGNKSNNVPINLEHATQSENVRHAHETGLHGGSRAVTGVSKSSNIEIYSVAEAARKMGVTRRVMRRIVGKNNKRFGYTWYFSEDLPVEKSPKKRKRETTIDQTKSTTKRNKV